MKKKKGGKRGRKKMDEREKESEVEERSEVITEEGTERNFHCGICKAAPRTVSQGTSTFPRQDQKRGCLGRNICRTQAPAL